MKKRYSNISTKPNYWQSLLAIVVFGLFFSIPGITKNVWYSGLDLRIDSNTIESITLNRANFDCIRSSTNSSNLLEDFELYQDSNGNSPGAAILIFPTFSSSNMVIAFAL